MKLVDLNKHLKQVKVDAWKKDTFNKIEKNLTDHIDKIEADAKEINIPTIISFENISKKLMAKIASLKAKNAQINVKDINAYKRKLIFLQNKFSGFEDMLNGNEFNKELVGKLRLHLIAIISDLENSLDDIDAIERAIKKLSKLGHTSSVYKHM